MASDLSVIDNSLKAFNTSDLLPEPSVLVSSSIVMSRQRNPNILILLQGFVSSKGQWIEDSRHTFHTFGRYLE